MAIWATIGESRNSGYHPVRYGLMRVLNAAATRSSAPAVTELHLSRGEVTVLNGIAGSIVVCTGGVLWITEEGSEHDTVLFEGQRFVTTRRGRLVVQGMTEAQLASAQAMR